MEDRQQECTNSLCTRQATDYQVLRTIRTLYDKLPYVGDYSSNEGPIDFEKSYIWGLHKSRGVNQAEMDALAHICESDFNGGISSLTFSSSLISSLEGYTILFHNQADIPNGAFRSSQNIDSAVKSVGRTEMVKQIHGRL